MDGTHERLTVALADDRSSVTIAFLPESGASGTLTMASEQLLWLITALGRAHAALNEGRDLPLLEGATVEAVFNTRWYVHSEMIGEASALSFYHPSFGPLGFLVPIDQTEEMIRLLSDQVALSKASRSGRPS